MENIFSQYLGIVTYGVNNHLGFLSDYFERELKKSELSKREFYQNINLVLDQITVRIKQQHKKQPTQNIEEIVVVINGAGFDIELINYIKESINNPIHLNQTSLKEEEKKIPKVNKLTWKGTPAQFGFIIDLLINKGYINQPTPYGERSAELLLSLFEFESHKPSKESLGKNLHKEIDPIKNPSHKSAFSKFPHRNDLDK